MKSKCVWHDYDPTDMDTHPTDAAKIEVEFADGSRYYGYYSRETGMIGMVGDDCIIPEEKLALRKRWRQVARSSTQKVTP